MNAEELYGKLKESGTGESKLRRVAALVAGNRKQPAEELVMRMAEDGQIPEGTIAKSVEFAGIGPLKLGQLARSCYALADILPAVKNCVQRLRVQAKAKVGSTAEEDLALAEKERVALDEQKQLEEDHLEGRTAAALAEADGFLERESDPLAGKGDGLGDAGYVEAEGESRGPLKGPHKKK